MKYKRILATAVLLSVVCTIVFTVGFAVSTTDNKNEVSSIIVDENKSISTEETVPLQEDGKEYLFAKYEPFGLTYDKQTHFLYFENKPVRYFEDYYTLYDGNAGELSFFNEIGTIDVYAVRKPCDSDISKIERNADGSFDSGGKVIGVKPYSQSEFDSLDIEQIKKDESCYTPEKPSRFQPIHYNSDFIDDLEEIYSTYEPFGLTYDREQDCLIYNGKKVRYFFDMMESNGETFSSGNFKGNLRELDRDGGIVDVYTIRDFTKSGEQGYGLLLEVKECTQGDFYSRNANQLMFICFEDNYD